MALRPISLDACFAALRFEGEIEDWIHRFKYPRSGLASLETGPERVLSELIVSVSNVIGSFPEVIVPIPLHRSRLRQRGFNPAARLACNLARAKGLDCDARALVRVRDTPSQTGLSRRARRRNVAGAFARRSGRALPREVWLVDDVVTTSATLQAAAHALKRSGVKRVTGVCVAHTPL